MGRGLGPTQRKVLDFLEEQWENPSDPTFVGVHQSVVADRLASTHSEAQAIRRAIRTLKDRKLIGTTNLINDFDWWLVPVGENARSLDPRPTAQGKMAGFREGIVERLTSDWHQLDAIRSAVLGDRPETPADGAWDKDRQLFNRALKQLVRQGVVMSIGATNRTDQSGWQVRLSTEQEREWVERLKAG